MMHLLHAGVAKQVHHRHDLGDHGDVLAGVERHHDLRNGNVEDQRLLPGQPGAVGVLGRLPVLELDHDLDSLLLPDRPHAEERGDVDQPDAADLHVVRGQLVSPARAARLARAW